MSSSATCEMAGSSRITGNGVVSSNSEDGAINDTKASHFIPRHYWKEALASLDLSQRRCLEETPRHSADLDTGNAVEKIEPFATHEFTDWPCTLVNVCHKLQNEYDEKRSAWHFRFLGQSIRIRDLLDGFVKVLDKIKKIGDIATAADPVHAGLPWAVIRALLMVRHFHSLVMCLPPTS